VQFAVPQDQLPELQARVREGAQLPATALDRTRTEMLATGHFSALDNQVDVQTGTVRAKARFDNVDSKLFPSQFVNLRLQVRTIRNAVVVPVAALRHGSDGDFVYVLNAQARTVSLRPVMRGQANVDKIQVVSGLNAGEQVITEGADRLKDGAKVVLPGDRPAMGGGGGGRRGQGGRGFGRGQGSAAPGQAAGPHGSADGGGPGVAGAGSPGAGGTGAANPSPDTASATAQGANAQQGGEGQRPHRRRDAQSQ
jgi:multidrug efflux system membrane fusion protein